MIASLLSRLDAYLRGFKDKILANEPLPSAANAYSRLLHSSLEQPYVVSSSPSTILDSSTLVSYSGGRGRVHGGPCGGREGRVFCSGSRGGRGDKKYDHYGGTNIILNLIVGRVFCSGSRGGRGDRKYDHYGGTNIILNLIVGKGMESQVMHIRSV
ncbi:hypothetical protein Acr_27g0002750 [Actinidia rufa]|uniref:Uncharacterized protein n=1 Tax=Actinidia rufa TaxID=165716 RepID=A0A7J0H622_9ERIC|nr:hypothetical protein Acr_27g0002750 [Actinidia rufa]